jgi:16S rRNA (uracil1498-N3)-methyltransferase
MAVDSPCGPAILAQMSERFYTNSALLLGPLFLQGPEAHHLANVMRAKPGDAVVLFTGDGVEYPATVVEVAKKSVALRVESAERPERELPFQLEIATAIPKGDRGDWMVEKLTELGVTRLVPLKMQRSVVHPKSDRLQRTVIEACKQCGRNRLMEVAEVTEWEEYCLTNSNHIRYIAHARDASTAGFIPAVLPNDQNLFVAIGPEGGFTVHEVAIATQAGWRTISLGPRTLRIETAAIALAAYFSLIKSRNA